MKWCSADRVPRTLLRVGWSETRFTVWFSRRDLLDDAHERRWPNVLVWLVLVGFSFRQRRGRDHLRHQVRPDRRSRRRSSSAPCTLEPDERPSASCRTRPTATSSPRAPSSWLGELARAAGLGRPAPVVRAAARGRLRGRPPAVPRHRTTSRDRPWLPMVAGLAYAFSPRLLGLVRRADRRDPADRGAALGGAAVGPGRSRGRLDPAARPVWSGVAVLLHGRGQRHRGAARTAAARPC